MKSGTAYALQQSLDDLHKESQEWLSEIRFWEIELIFLQKLLKRASHLGSSEYDDRIIEGLHLKLDSFRKDTAVLFSVSLMAHEKYLADLLQNIPGRQDASYRQQHSEHQRKLRQREKGFRALKKEVFEVVEGLM